MRSRWRGKELRWNGEKGRRGWRKKKWKKTGSEREAQEEVWVVIVEGMELTDLGMTLRQSRIRKCANWNERGTEKLS